MPIGPDHPLHHPKPICCFSARVYPCELLQNFEDLIIDVEGDRENGELPALFKKIHADVRFIGNLDPQKALRACELSFTKYCSVSKTLEATAEISFSVYVNGEKVS